MGHYSASQINMYLRCPAQWAFRYVENIIQPPSSAMVQGTSYHKAIEVNYGQKIESKIDLPLADVKDAYATTFDEKIKETDATEKEIGALKDEGVKLVEVYQKEVSPQINPAAVEKEFNIEFDNVDYSIKGFIDVVEENGLIHENKTTARTPSEVSSDHLLQGTFYALAEKTDEIVFDYAVKLKTPKVITFQKKISNVEKDFALRIAAHVDHAIKSEVFMPNRNSFLCKKSTCAYWRRCLLLHGGAVKD